MTRPIVVVSTCTKQFGGAYPYFGAQIKYVDAVLRGAGCMPLMLPALGTDTDINAVLDACDGVMLTGSPSNVHP
ncbi:MAG TPA: gamma-glutamyl-gamma-aminobutyrate hydrolase family protein, partial [Burkholderiaceae bacterium]